jgi:FkbM family methyltransferase
MDLRSVVRLRDYLLDRPDRRNDADGLLALTIRRPFKGTIHLRRQGSDFPTFVEIVRRNVYAIVPRRLTGCRTIIDLGANVGLTSLCLAAMFAKASIFAVEPNADTFRLLNRNLARLIARRRCQTLRAAVWSSERVLVGDASSGADQFAMFAAREPSSTEAMEGSFPGLPASQILATSGFQYVDLLKVDIEGAEVQLFAGDLGWLERVGAIAIEFHGDSRVVSQFDDIMTAHGLRVVDDSAHTVIATRHAFESCRPATA